MTAPDTDTLAGLLAAATPGEWEEITPEGGIWPPRVFSGSTIVSMVDNSDMTHGEKVANARLIALAPSLAAEVIALRAQAADLEARLAAANKQRRESDEKLTNQRHEINWLKEQQQALKDSLAAAEADRDDAKEYAAQARIRENKAEDARVSAIDRATRAEAGEDALAEALRITCERLMDAVHSEFDGVWSAEDFNEQEAEAVSALAAYEARRKG